MPRKTIEIEKVDNAHTIKGSIEELDEKKLAKIKANLDSKYSELVLVAGPVFLPQERKVLVVIACTTCETPTANPLCVLYSSCSCSSASTHSRYSGFPPQTARMSSNIWVYFSTDVDRTPQAILERYARRWSLEVTFRNVKQDLGLEDPRNGWWRRKHGSRRRPKKAGPEPRGNRGRRAVERTAPLIFLAHAFVIAWYLKHGNPISDVRRALRLRPWDRQKTEPAFGDMLRAVRRTIWRRRLSQHPGLRAVFAKAETLLPMLEVAA